MPTFEIGFSANNGQNSKSIVRVFSDFDAAVQYAKDFLQDWWQEGAFANVFCPKTERFAQVYGPRKGH